MITGFLLCGLGGWLVYRKVKETAAAIKSPLRLPDLIETVGRAVGALTVNLQQNREYNRDKFAAQQRRFEDLEAFLKGGREN